MHVEAEHVGDRLGVATELGSNQTQDGLAGTRAEQAYSASRGAVARSQGQLLFGERVIFGVARALEQAFERTAVALEDAADASRRAARDLSDLFGRRLTERVEDELAVVGTHVDAVDGERVGVNIEQQGVTIPCRRKSRFITRSILLRVDSGKSCRALGAASSRSPFVDRTDSISRSHDG